MEMNECDENRIVRKSARAYLIDYLKSRKAIISNVSGQVKTDDEPNQSIAPLQSIENIESESNLFRLHCLKLIKTKSEENNNNLTVENESTEKEPMKIVDVIYDCLVPILRHLKFQDLVNVSVSCKYLRTVARDVFNQRVRNREVVINCDSFPYYMVKGESKVWSRQSMQGRNINDFLCGLGAEVTKITIHNMYTAADNIERDEQIERTIMLNKQDSDGVTAKSKLRAMEFVGCGRQTMRQVQSFNDVTSVSFNRCDLTSHFLDAFSNAKRLELIDCTVSADDGIIDRPFPLLTHLSLYMPFSDHTFANMSFTIATIKKAIDNNQQIQNLSLCHWKDFEYNANVLKYVADNLTNLKCLILWHYKHTDFSTHGDIHFETVRKFVLNYEFRDVFGLQRNLSALTFNGLERFYLLGPFGMECIEFLARHDTINKFICMSTDSTGPTDKDMLKFAETLPNLEKIVLSGLRLTLTGLIQFISKCSSVQQIKIDRYNYSAVMLQLFQYRCSESGWKVIITNRTKQREFIMKRLRK